MSRNVGLPVGLNRLWFKVEGLEMVHHYFHIGYADKVLELVQTHDPDMLLLQEIPDKDAAQYLIEHSGFDYSRLVWTPHQNHYRLYLSKMPISSGSNDEDGHYIQYGSINIFNIHLHSRNPRTRRKQVQTYIDLMENVGRENVCMIGDYNFWQFAGVYLSLYDKRSSELLQTQLENFTNNVGRTSIFGLALDRCYASKGLIQSVEVLQEKGRYMDHYPLLVTLHD